MAQKAGTHAWTAAVFGGRVGFSENLKKQDLNEAWALVVGILVWDHFWEAREVNLKTYVAYNYVCFLVNYFLFSAMLSFSSASSMGLERRQHISNLGGDVPIALFPSHEPYSLLSFYFKHWIPGSCPEPCTGYMFKQLEFDFENIFRAASRCICKALHWKP